MVLANCAGKIEEQHVDTAENIVAATKNHEATDASDQLVTDACTFAY